MGDSAPFSFSPLKPGAPGYIATPGHEGISYAGKGSCDADSLFYSIPRQCVRARQRRPSNPVTYKLMRSLSPKIQLVGRMPIIFRFLFFS